jgi:hypothetical protein
MELSQPASQVPNAPLIGIIQPRREEKRRRRRPKKMEEQIQRGIFRSSKEIKQGELILSFSVSFNFENG